MQQYENFYIMISVTKIITVNSINAVKCVKIEKKT